MGKPKLEMINRTTYCNFIVNALEENGGVMSNLEMRRKIHAYFNTKWSELDKQKLANGHTNAKTKTRSVARWENEVDWAKVQGRRLDLFVYKWGIYFLCEYTDLDLLILIERLTKKKKMVKFCRGCKKSAPLLDVECKRCGKKFPKAKKRREVAVA